MHRLGISLVVASAAAVVYLIQGPTGLGRETALSAGIISLGTYNSEPLKSWKAIPEPARSRILWHVKERVGEEFFGRLKFVEGELVNLERLKAESSLGRQWEVFTYRVHLRLENPAGGIAHVEGAIEARADGSIIRELSLPAIARHPENGLFIPLKDAVALTRINGFDPGKSEFLMRYLKDEELCVLAVSQLIREEGPRLFYKCLEIDAHSGAIRRAFDAEGMR